MEEISNVVNRKHKAFGSEMHFREQKVPRQLLLKIRPEVRMQLYCPKP